MKREIKFRAWNGIKMYYPETKTPDNNATYLTFFNRENSIGWGLYDSVYENRLCSGEYHNLMQFTGLKDKNGKDIYEGDIIKFWGSIPSDDPAYGYYEPTMSVCYSEVWASFGFTDGGAFLPFKQWDDMEIIGNIYENPELL